jgi:aerobic carbon-monoxide dehydrogenase large subunit
VAIGKRRLRVEDRPLLTGSAEFVDDIRREAALEAAFVRSPVAHARLLGLDLESAAALSGVETVLGAGDLDLAPLEPPCTNPDVTTPPQPPLARDKVRFAGEPIAVAAAVSRYRAEDARDAVQPELEPLEPLTDPWRAIAEDAPAIHDGISNCVVDTRADSGDVDGAFAAAARVVERTFRSPRHSALPIETRAVIAAPLGDGLEVWTSSQGPHKVRQAICEVLGLETGNVRVVTPDVGGGFGVKAHVYPEEIVIAALALRLGRPVRWVEDRAENLAASTQARQQELTVRAALSANGELLALDVNMICDQGAYGAYPHGVTLEALTTSGLLPGPYRLRNYRLRARTAITNKAPAGAYRGVGFTVAAFVHERLMDVLARESGLDPAEIRRRNLIGADDLPYISVTNHPYDNGDYRRALDAALERIGYEQLVSTDARSSRPDRRRGVGIACYVEPTGMNSKVFERRGMVGIAGYDGAHVALDPEGGVRVWTTTPAIGQGSETTLAQVAAERLGIDADRIRVERSDTAVGELDGTGTFASRSAASAGGAVVEACVELHERVIDAAAERLEASPGDLVIDDGTVHVAGSPTPAVAISELVSADPERYRLSATFDLPQTVYPYATHACQVSVDTETGEVQIERYVIAEDCGTMINPLIVEGQVQGATAQGVGGALYEAHDYDADGQLRTASLLDYLVPTATEIPAMELIHLELPSPITATGVKGVGEGGTIGATPAIVNALSDALGVELNSFPVTPEQIVAAARG